MPNVPTLEPQVRNAPPPTVRFSDNASAASFGGRQARNLGMMADALRQVGEQGVDIALQQQDRVNRITVRDALNSAQSEAMDWDTKVRGMRGKDALGVVDLTKDWTSKTKKRYLDGLENDRQRELFNSVFDGVERQSMGHAQSHEQVQVERWDTETKQAENKLLTDNAAANYSSPEIRGQAQLAVEMNARRLAEKEFGLDATAAVEGAVQKARDNFHLQLLSKVAKQGPEGAKFAKAHYEELKAKAAEENQAAKGERGLRSISQEALAEIGPWVESVSDEQEAWDTARKLEASGKSFEDQLEAAKKLDNPKVAAQVRQYLHQSRNERLAWENAQERKAADEALSAYIKTGEIPTLANGAHPEVVERIRRMADHDAKEAAAGRAAQRTGQAYMDLIQIDAAGQLREMPFEKLAEKLVTLTPGERTEFLRKWADGRDPEPLVKIGLKTFDDATSGRQTKAKRNIEKDRKMAAFRASVQDDLRRMLKDGKLKTEADISAFVMQRAGEKWLDSAYLGITTQEVFPENASETAKPAHVVAAEKKHSATAYKFDGKWYMKLKGRDFLVGSPGD